MNLHEIGILSAFLLKADKGKDVAVLVRADTRRPQSWSGAGAGGARRADTAAVRVMQAQAQQGFANADYYLYTTVPPTDMDLGMARRCHVVAIVYLDNGRLRYKTPADVGGGARRLTQAMREMIAGMWQWEDQWRGIEAQLERNEVPDLTTTFRNGNVRALEVWVNALSRIREAAVIWLLLPRQEELQAVPPPRFTGFDILRRFPTGRHTRTRDKIFMTLTFALLYVCRHGANAGDNALEGQQIAAILVGPNGRVLSWGVNTNTTNVTRHGETNCIQAFFDQYDADIPDDSTLYTTLRSCEMCAAMLTTTARNLRVVYGARDPGVNATALSLGLNHCAEERFAFSHSDPVVRLRFQRAVARVMERGRERFRQVERQRAQTAFAANVPRVQLPKGSSPAQHKQSGDAYRARQVRYVESRVRNVERDRDFIDTSAMLPPIPQAITAALSSAGSMRNIATYFVHYAELGELIVNSLLLRLGYDLPVMRVAALADASDDDILTWMCGVLLLLFVRASAIEH